MAQKKNATYAVATGNDYAEHERTYDNVMKLTKVGVLTTLCILVCLALIGLKGAFWWMLLGMAATAAAAIRGLFTEDGSPILLGGLLVFLLIVLGLLG